MNDFSPEGGEGFVIDGTVKKQPKKEIVKRQNRATADSAQKASQEKRDSLLAKAARNKLASLALAGVAVGIGGKVFTSDTHAESGDDGSRASANLVISNESAKNPMPEGLELASSEKLQDGHNLFDTVYHDLSDEERKHARETVDMYKDRIRAKTNYQEVHRQIPMEYKSVIEDAARAYGISVDAFLGIIAVENGGGTAVMNESSGAIGVAQFLPDTARQYGLIVNDVIDQRTDPVLSIDAAGRYLRDHKALFAGDEGLTVWSYHAGVGNVFRAMRVYFIDKYGEDIGDYAQTIVDDDPRAREKVEADAHKMMKKDKLDIHKLLSNQAVQEKVTSGLDDYSASYPPSVVAAVELLHEHEKDTVLASAPRTSPQ